MYRRLEGVVHLDDEGRGDAGLEDLLLGEDVGHGVLAGDERLLEHLHREQVPRLDLPRQIDPTVAAVVVDNYKKYNNI